MGELTSTDRTATTTAGIRAAALVLAASGLASRLVGYGRDWLIGFEFGATGQTDVYQASFTLPDLINYLLAGGALSVSLLPRMAALYAEPGGDRPGGPADRAFSTVCSAMIVAASVFVGVAWIAAFPIVRWWFPGFDDAKVALTVHLTRIVLPAQIFFLVGGLFQAALLARQRFRALALTPLLYNGGIIAGGLIGGQFGHIEGFSWGALAGAAVGGLAVPVWAARDAVRFRFAFRPTDEELRRFLWIAAPLMIGVSLTTVDEWLAKRFGSTLGEGAISWLMTARRVMLVPIGVVGGAAGQATGAYLARLHAEGRRSDLAEVLGRAVAATVALSLVAASVLAALAEPTVSLLFQYGRFSAADAARSAEALAVIAWAIPAWGAQQVIARALYAAADTWRPMVATTLVTIAVLPVYAIGAHWPGRELEGVCAAGALGITLQAITVGWIARQRLGLSLAIAWRGVWRGAVTAAVAGLTAWAVDRAFGAGVARASLEAGAVAPLARAAGLAVAGLPAVAAAVAVAALVGMPGLPIAVTRAVERVAGRRTAR